MNNKKKLVAQAFTELRHAFQTKKRKMSESEKEKADAMSQRQFYYEKIVKFGKSMANFDELTQHQLKEKSNRLKELFEKFEMKCLNLGCVDPTAMATQEDDEIEALSSTLQSKIAKRLDILDKEEAKINAQNAIDSQCDANKNEQGAQGQQQITNKSEMLTQNNQKRKINVNYANFSGNVFEWRNFEKQFKTEVADNNELNEEEKYEYLKEACKDEVLVIISNAENQFTPAWKALKELYGDAYNQVQLCTHRLIAISKVQQASSQSLASLLNKATKCMNVLKDIIPGTDDSLFTVIAASKLDVETSRMWDRNRNALAVSWATQEDGREKNQHMPAWDDFKTFLNDEIMIYAKHELRACASQMTLPKAGKSNDSRTATPKAGKVDSNASSSIIQNNSHKIANVVHPQQTAYQYNTVCPCRRCNHLYKCEEYLKLDYNGRWRFVEENCLCQRCTRVAHPNVPCENKSNNEPCPLCIHHDQNAIYYHNSTMPVRFGLHPN